MGPGLLVLARWRLDLDRRLLGASALSRRGLDRRTLGLGWPGLCLDRGEMEVGGLKSEV